MVYRLETALKDTLKDPEGDVLKKKAYDYFKIELNSVRTVKVLLFDLPVSHGEFESFAKEIFSNPVTEVFSSFSPDWIVNLVSEMSFLTHFKAMTKGVLDFRDIFYYFSVIIFMLTANTVIINTGRN